MTYSKENLVDCTGTGQTDWSLYSLDREAELERLDREAGHDYLPMDVFVDLRTMKEHFQDSAVRARWAKTQATARHIH